MSSLLITIWMTLYHTWIETITHSCIVKFSHSVSDKQVGNLTRVNYVQQVWSRQPFPLLSLVINHLLSKFQIVCAFRSIHFVQLGSLRWDDSYARERQAEVKHKNTGLPSVFIHPSSLGGNCKTTLMSSHRKRSLLFLYFPVGNSVCQLFAQFISRIPFLYYAVHFLASFCQKFPNRMWIQWATEQQQFVRGRDIPAKDVRTVCARL